jgi:hypothetical protein
MVFSNRKRKKAFKSENGNVISRPPVLPMALQSIMLDQPVSDPG